MSDSCVPTLLLVLAVSCAQYKRSSDTLLINQPQPYLILGRDTSEPLTAQNIDLYKGIVPAIGRIELPTKEACTVTHIGDSLGISAGHCVNEKNCPLITIQWLNANGVLGSPNTRCVEVLSWGNPEHMASSKADYVIFQMKDNVPSSFVKINKQATVSSSDEIFVIGFRSNIDKTPILSPKCFFNKTQTDKDTGLSPHSCSVEGGSSGALLFKQKGFFPIAIHSRGKGDSNFAMPVENLPSLN